MCEATAWRSHELSGAKDSERSERGQASEARTLCTFVWNSYTVHDNEWKRLSFAHPARCRRSPLQAKPAAGAGGVGVEPPQQTPDKTSAGWNGRRRDDSIGCYLNDVAARAMMDGKDEQKWGANHARRASRSAKPTLDPGAVSRSAGPCSLYGGISLTRCR